MVVELSQWSDDDLASLFELRPDLLSPPTSWATLAYRVASPASLARALGSLDEFSIAVVHGACLLGPTPSTTGLLAVLGLGADDGDALAEAIEGLRARALMTVDGARVRVPEEVARAIPRPAGLGPSVRSRLAAMRRDEVDRVAVLLGLVDKKGAGQGTKDAAVARALEAITDPVRVRKGLRHAVDGAAELFEAMVADGSVVRNADAVWLLRQPRHPIGWLGERALLVPGPDGLAVPREVGLAFRGGVAFPGLTVRAPSVESTPIDHSAVVAAGAAAAIGAVSAVERVVTEWAARPAPTLKSGGVGVRELKRPAKAAGLDEATAALVVELAAAAGLLALEADEVRATPAWDEWRRQAPADRWVALVRGWLASWRWPGLAGRKDVKGKVIPALDPRDRAELAHLQRRAVLEALQAAGEGDATTEALLARALWRAPALFRQGPYAPAAAVESVRAEAAFLGVTALGALTPAGRGLVADAVGVGGGGVAVGGSLDTGALVEMFGRPVTEVTLQADLTAMVVGTAEPDLAAVLDDAADVESRGAATVWRFSDASVRRALDRGRTAEELTTFLTDHATRGLPQPLAYLIGDVGRRHGEVRVGTATSYVRSDDAGLLARAVAGPRGRRLGLRLLAQGVATAAVAPSELLAFLRDEGLAPVEEDAAGLTVPVGDTGPRAARPVLTFVGPPAGDAGRRGRTAALAAVAALRASAAAGQKMPPLVPPARSPMWAPFGDVDDVGDFDDEGVEEPAAILALLTEAERTGFEVDLEWTEGTGRHRRPYADALRIVSVTGSTVVAVSADRLRRSYRIALEDVEWAARSAPRPHSGEVLL